MTIPLQAASESEPMLAAPGVPKRSPIQVPSRPNVAHYCSVQIVKAPTVL